MLKEHNTEFLDLIKKNNNVLKNEKIFVLNGIKELVSYFIKKGKKRLIFRLIRKAFFLTAQNGKKNIWIVLKKLLIDNMTFVNVVEVKRKRTNKKIFKIIPIQKHKQKSLCYSWIKQSLTEKQSFTFSNKFLEELNFIEKNKSIGSKKKRELHRLALEHSWFMKKKKQKIYNK